MPTKDNKTNAEKLKDIETKLESVQEQAKKLNRRKNALKKEHENLSQLIALEAKVEKLEKQVQAK